ncbi:wall-associated receptor kinase-like 1 [Gastrolobium bilobum]|uniref:wall-associated receptor kinase-like 1 n=1 Tax=Gastrolobium bilobum TaxID=150636 RepID=UPI002AB0CA63|nr:wall-associated receptor kinase-like 1 [Gastrolobium bilobum]
MVVQFAFHIIILMIVGLIYPLASAQNIITTQSGCDYYSCGIGIPYPFGIGDPKCYADKWFEIECRNTSQGEIPYLKSLNLEVTSIDDSNSKVNIMNPVFSWNCKSKDSRPIIDLKGSPFVFSKDDNKFTAIGCNKIAFLQSNGSQVSGCVSVCDEYDNEQVNNNIDFGSDGCLGRFCCQTSLPEYLSEFNVTLENLSNRSVSDECSHALIATEYWYRVPFGNSYEYRSFRDLDVSYVPAVLDWVILNSSMKVDHAGANCTIVPSSLYRPSGWRCECSLGAYGDPYITGGCVAISGFFDTNSQARKRAIVGVLSSIGSIILFFVLWLLHKVVRKRMIKKRKEKFFKKNGGLLLQQRMSSGEVNVDQTILFSLKELEKATDNFNTNRVLGKGGQGTVYKGMLVDGRIVAVKKFKVEGKVEEFINEFVILSQINHRNVVRLLGCCLETEIPLLVYEFIPNGNLFEYLHDENEVLPMTWDMRLRIATEIAGALFYLHSLTSQPIYHRDIKSTNILLDEKYRAKVADFGASRIVSIEATHLTTVVQGTFGYLDPEYFQTSQLTEKSDVYSFGVVLVELLTGKKPISSTISEETKSLASYFVQSMEENRLFDIIDKRVTMEGDKEHIIAVANLGNRCLELNGRKRPTMKEVTLELEEIRRLDRKSNAQQNPEEIELAGIQDYQPWAEYSTSNSLTTLSSATLSRDTDIMHILPLK